MASTHISEVIVISVDKSDESWAIEGEIIFDGDLSSAFEVTYLPEEDDLVDLELEINPGSFDKSSLKDKIMHAVVDFDE